MYSSKEKGCSIVTGGLPLASVVQAWGAALQGGWILAFANSSSGRAPAEVSDNTCQTASRGLARSLKPVFTRGEVLTTVDSLMGLAVGLRCGGNV